MKKEINLLLASEDGELKINEMFRLRRWTKDALGNRVDMLKLETTQYGRYDKSVKIEARDINGIIAEVESKIAQTMKDISEEMCARWKGGLLY